MGVGSFRLFLFHLSLQQMLLEGEGGETGPRPASETPKPLCPTQQGGGGHPCTAQLSLEGGSLRQASGGGPLPGTRPHWEMRSGYELWLGVGRQRVENPEQLSFTNQRDAPSQSRLQIG